MWHSQLCLEDTGIGPDLSYPFIQMFSRLPFSVCYTMQLSHDLGSNDPGNIARVKTLVTFVLSRVNIRTLKDPSQWILFCYWDIAAIK